MVWKGRTYRLRAAACAQLPWLPSVQCGVHLTELRKRAIMNYITREDFGFALFDAVACCGNILQLQHRREHTPPNRIHPGQLTAWQQSEREFVSQLRSITHTLDDTDVAELMRRYPFIAGI